MVADVSPGLSKYYEFVLKKMDGFVETIDEEIHEEDLEEDFGGRLWRTCQHFRTYLEKNKIP